MFAERANLWHRSLMLKIKDHRIPQYISPEITEPGFSGPAQPQRRPFFTRMIFFFILLSVWVLLSGRFDFFHLTLGIISCALVTFFSGDLLSPELRNMGLLRSWARFIGYIPWLLYQIFLANLHILYLVFHPRMIELIDPKIIRFQSKFKKELPLVIFANSITLTPGTITVYVSVDGEFQVHAIDEKSGAALPGEMESRILKALGEK